MTTRRLAAILTADVVGFSKLIGGHHATWRLPVNLHYGAIGSERQERGPDSRPSPSRDQEALCCADAGQGFR
jgi:hypothetical protein